MSEQFINTSPEYLALVNIIYPIGHIYKSTRDINPGTFIPGTTWERLLNRFLYNSSEGITVREGGEITAELSEVPSHNHESKLYNRSHYSDGNPYDYRQAASSSPGGSVSYPEIPTTSAGSGSNPRHNNMPPYRAIYMWRRLS